MSKRFFIFLLSLLLASCVRSFAPSNANAPIATPTRHPDPCRAKDFAISSGLNVIEAKMMIGITLQNISAMTCIVSGNPQVLIADRGGNPITITTRYTTSAETPELSIRPSETIVISVIWDQWCNSLPADEIEIHLTLAGGEMIERVKNIPAGTCSPNGTSSTLTISGFGYTP
jgi:hypothetical protein